MDTVLKDLKYALRLLLKSPGFTTVAVLTLALGIGANTAMFSVVTAVLLRPLPFPEPNRIVAVGPRATRSGLLNSSSYPDFYDYRDRSRSFEELAAYHDSGDQTLTGVGDPQHVRVVVATSGFFEALGIRPVLGRSFIRADEKAGQNVVILSDRFWRGQFGADPNVIGRGITLRDRPFTVIGVMPAGFQFPIESTATDLWMSTSRDAEGDLPGDTPVTTQRGAHFLLLVGRLKRGVTPEQAESELRGHIQSLAREYPDTNTNFSNAYVRPQLENLVGDTKKPLMILLAAVGLVLLIACANIANLLLARSTGRTREIALRAALGATRTRIVRQLVTEAFLLASAGAVLGVLLSSFATSAIVHLYPKNLPRLAEIAIDYRVALFTIAATLSSAALFGLVPALQVARPRLESALKEGGRSGTSSHAHMRLRSILVVTEIALGVVLMVGAGLLVRSFQRLYSVNPGFNPHSVVALNFDLPSGRYNNEKAEQFNLEFYRRVRDRPGVKDAGGILTVPLSGDRIAVDFDIEGRNIPKRSQPSEQMFIAIPRYFETMQIPLLRGRTFDERDQRRAPKVIIVTQSFADKYFPGEDPIGKHIKPGAYDESGEPPWREIIGVVADIRAQALGEKPAPAFYFPASQLFFGEPTLLVRSPADPSVVVSQVRDVLKQMDPEVPLYDIKTMDDFLALSLGREKFQTVLLGIFAAIALALTAVGLYGVIAYTVMQRTQEIGIRMALGATPGSVLSMVLRNAGVMAVAGIVAGVIGAVILTGFMQSMLFGVHARDPLTMFAVCVVLGAVALIASYIPARRATKVDPMVALRYE